MGKQQRGKASYRHDESPDGDKKGLGTSVTPLFKGGESQPSPAKARDNDVSTQDSETIPNSPSACGVCRVSLAGKLFYGRISGGEEVVCSKSCEDLFILTDYRERRKLLDSKTAFPNPPTSFPEDD